MYLLLFIVYCILAVMMTELYVDKPLQTVTYLRHGRYKARICMRTSRKAVDGTVHVISAHVTDGI